MRYLSVLKYFVAVYCIFFLKICIILLSYLFEFFENLKKIGYKTASNTKLRKLLIIAFQTKFRKELINGKIDMECLMISKKLNNT